MKTLILFLILIIMSFSCGDEPDPPYDYKHIDIECYRDIKECCKIEECTEEEEHSLLEEFCKINQEII